MAPKKNVAPSVNTTLLQAISDGSVTHVSQNEAALAGIGLTPPLIEVDTTQIVDGKAAVRLTAAGVDYAGNGAAQPASAVSASPYALISGAVLPPSKRKGGGGIGAPKKYPFDEMVVGQTFFVPATTENPDPVKKLGSTVSSANMRYAEKVGTKEAERTVRGPGNKAVKNPDGSNKREVKTVDVYKQTRKYTIRPVVAGTVYGEWTAPANGALIGRVE